MSRRLQHEMRRAVLLFAVVLLAFVCAPLVCAPHPAWAANDTATITAKVRVFQEYYVSVSGLENKFTYLIVPSEDDAPLPVDESGKAFDSFTLTRNEDAWLKFAVPVEAASSAKAYAYHYTLKPATDEFEDGLYYVDAQSTSLDAGVNVYYLELYVQSSSEDAAATTVTPLVHVDGWDGPKVSDPGWRVGYDYALRGPSSPGPSIFQPDPNSPGISSPAPEPTYDSGERSSVDSGNGSGNDPATSSMTKGAATSSYVPAKTGDDLTPWLVMACVACAVAFPLIFICLFRRKPDEDDA